MHITKEQEPLYQEVPSSLTLAPINLSRNESSSRKGQSLRELPHDPPKNH